jgi:hypothetical protein
MAGRYALACQEDPAMTPQRFFDRSGRLNPTPE